MPRRTPTRALAPALAAALVLLLGAALAPVAAAAPTGERTGTGPNGQTLTVSPVDDLDPAGTVVDVRGAGFTTANGFNVATAGLYVAFCVDNGPAQAPSPCVGGIDMEGEGGSSKWVTNNPLPGVPPEAVVPVTADGRFETTITVQAADENVDCLALPAGQECKVVTRMDHRASGNRTQDVKVPVTFGDGTSEPDGPQLSLSPATGLDPDGADVVVTGTGYPTDGPGLYVVYGPEPENSIDASPYQRTALVVPGSEPGQIDPDGSFTVTLEDVQAAYIDGSGDERDFLDGGGFVSTFRAHGVPDPDGRWQASAPVAFAGAAVTPSDTGLISSTSTVEAGQPVVLTAEVTAGGSPVTSGTVELRDGATSLGTAALGSGGRATRSVTFATTGARQVTAHYAGTETVGASASPPVTITVTSASTPPPPPPPPGGEGEPRGTRTGTGPNGQTLTVTPVDDLDPAGTDVQVRGAGYDAAAGFDVDEGGLYVAFCVDNGPGAAPSPCIGGVDMEGEGGASKWVTNNPYPGVPPEAVVPVGRDGSFETTITLVARDEFVDCLDGETTCVVASRADHRASSDRSQDVKVPVCFAGQAACATEVIPPGGGGPDGGFTGFPLTPGGSAGPGTVGSGGAGGPTSTGGLPLASTGSDLRPLALGTALLLGGAVLLLAARRTSLRRAPRAIHTHTNHLPGGPRP